MLMQSLLIRNPVNRREPKSDLFVFNNLDFVQSPWGLDISSAR